MMPPVNTTPLDTNQLNTYGGRTIKPVLIEAVDGPGVGAKAMLRAGTFVVGSATGCDLVLKDPQVSRRHLVAELLPGMVQVRDLDSRNGTIYLGARIDSAKVPTGGLLTVGKTTLRFSPVDDGGAPVSQRSELCGMLGESRAMRQLFAMLEKLGPTDASVLILGETGVGKEAVARAVHSLSARADARFVVFDCASVQGNLIESELFGHAKGAYTHAADDRLGALEYASGGTLFFDEIGELPLELQPKLLRALDSREFRPVGSMETRKCNARIIAATHRDLAADVRAGLFRADLYYRLAVTTVEVPPLRERPEDIPLLARAFARLSGAEERALTKTTLAALRCEQWPGNVRELRNAVERLMAQGKPPPRPSPDAAAAGFKGAREWLLKQFERDYLVEVMQRHEGNVSAAARESGLSRSQFYRLLWQYDLAPKDEG
jgi:DNA-binding NtrC family response regulator